MQHPLVAADRSGKFARRALRKTVAVAHPKAEAAPKQDLTDFVDMEHYPSEFKEHARAHWAAMINYYPQPFDGRVLLFRTPRPRLLTYTPEYQWRRLAKKVDVHVIEGTHENVLEDPQAKEVAEIVKREMDAVW